MRSARGKVAKCSPVFAGCTAATMSTFVNIRGASDRAAFTARRKEAYEALHPETKHGGDRSSSRQVGDLDAGQRFTADTAAKTGQSERGVQRDAERGEKVCDDALRLLRGNPYARAGIAPSSNLRTPPKGCVIPGREGAGQISGAFSIGTGAGGKIPAFTYQRI